MKWFNEDDSGIALDIKEWAKALENVEDLDNMTKLGKKAYSDCLMAAKAKRDPGMDGALKAFAHTLHHMMDEMDEEMWADLRWAMEGEWRFKDRSFWESPAATLTAYAPDSLDGPVSVLERIGRDLNHFIRPNLYRLIFAMLVAEGRKIDQGYLEAGDPTATSLMVPMGMLDRLMAEGVPNMLDEDEAMGLWHLAQDLSIGGRMGIETDEIALAIMDRRYFVDGKKVRIELYMHSRGGTVFSIGELSSWNEQMVQAMAALSAFKVMLIAATIGETGQLHPEFGRGGA